MASIILENDFARVAVSPAYGARVTSLIDRRSGRDWISPGGESAAIGEDAVFSADEAVGWDECFPTVSPWDAHGTIWQRRLRDHGDLWGRPWTIEAANATTLSTSFATADYRFTRTLTLDGDTLTAAYAVDNRSAGNLPWMWALHALLAVSSADRIVLPSVGSVDTTYAEIEQRRIAPGKMPWPGQDDIIPFPLDEVQPAERHFAGKFYAKAARTAVASIGDDRGWLDIGWQGDEAPFLGIWLAYGGWPKPGPIMQVALEPTTAPADHLGGALDGGTAILQPPGTIRAWSVALTLRQTRANL